MRVDSAVLEEQKAEEGAVGSIHGKAVPFFWCQSINSPCAGTRDVRYIN